MKPHLQQPVACTFASTSRPCCTCRCTQSPAHFIRCTNWMEQRNINKIQPQHVEKPYFPKMSTIYPPCIHHVFHGFPQDVHHISIYPTWIHHVFPEMSTIYPPFITHLPIVSSHPMASPRGPRHHGTSRPRSTVRGGPRHVRLQGIEGRGLVLRGRRLAVFRRSMAGGLDVFVW